MDDYKLILRGNSFIGKYRIYRGGDHLLLLEQVFFSQRYYRFFFTDIQGIVARKTAHFAVAVAALGIAIGLFVIGFLPSSGQGHPAVTPANGVLMGFSSIAAVSALIVVLRGKTGKIQIVTKVQRKRIGNVVRWKKWLAMKKTVVPIIKEQQEHIQMHERNDPRNILTSQAAPGPGGNEQPDSQTAV